MYSSFVPYWRIHFIHNLSNVAPIVINIASFFHSTSFPQRYYVLVKESSDKHLNVGRRRFHENGTPCSAYLRERQCMSA